MKFANRLQIRVRSQSKKTPKPIPHKALRTLPKFANPQKIELSPTNQKPESVHQTILNQTYN